MKKTLLIFSCFCFTLLHAQNHLLPSRAAVDASLAPFYHGVASGDPLSDRVILWTRITSQNVSETVGWQIATDTVFTNSINSGSVITDASKDYTVKVDATGLQPDTWYYYRFSNNGIYSVIGRTRTNPSGSVADLRFAVLACSNYQSGFFNAYRDIVNKNDVDAVIHLGDYYYEYSQNDFSNNADSQRFQQPPHEILNIADYRIRHSFFKLDPDLRDIHQQFPFIVEWDDHESANNSWYGGAENHDSTTEGNWYDRKEDSRTAYFEWMPIRDVHKSVDTIHRTIPMGNLADLVMIDTRLEGRERQMGTTGAATDTNRTLLGTAQLAWFKQQLSSSTAKWKIIGNQVMMAPLVITGIGAINDDQWDGYPAERNKVLRHLSDNNINNFVVLTGDIHTSWANDLPHPDSVYSKTTGHGSAGVEFVCTSVTSEASPLPIPDWLLLTVLPPHMMYAELSKKGYVLLDITDQKVQGDWIYMSTILSKNFTSAVGASWCDLDGANHLTQCGSALTPRGTNPPLTAMYTGVSNLKNDDLVMIAIYPNPSVNEIAIQYYLQKPGEVKMFVTDMNGRTIYIKTISQTQSGLFNAEADISTLAAGNYILSITSGSKTYSQQFTKGK